MIIDYLMQRKVRFNLNTPHPWGSSIDFLPHVKFDKAHDHKSFMTNINFIFFFCWQLKDCMNRQLPPMHIVDPFNFVPKMSQ